MRKSLLLTMVLMVYAPVHGLCADGWTYYSTESGLGSNAITNMFFADDGTLWCVHDTYRDTETPYAMSGYTNSGWIHIGLDDFPVDGYASSEYRLIVNEARPFGDTILLATNRGLFRYNGNGITRVEEFEDFPVMSAFIQGDTIWVSGRFSAWDRNAISFTDGGMIETFYTGRGSYEFSHHILGFDSGGTLWTSGGNGRTKGLYRYDGKHWERVLVGDIYDGMRLMPDESLWFWGRDAELLVLGDGVFGKTNKYISGWSLSGEAWSWSSVIKNNTVYPLGYYEHDIEQYIQDDFFVTAFYTAADDTSLWIGSIEYGVLQVSSAFLEAYITDTTWTLSTEVVESKKPLDIGYGDDYRYFPMHIGDTWTYARSWRGFMDSNEHSDLLHRTIIDTVWVDGEVYFEFLDGDQQRYDMIDEIVYRDGEEKILFDFNYPEEEYYVFDIGSSSNPYYPHRITTDLDLPAGYFYGYDFSYSDWPGGEYFATIPYIGVGIWGLFTDTQRFERLKLISASIDGKSIEEILAAEEPSPATFNLTAFPNPFNPRTTISFAVPDAALVTLTVYSVTGQKVVTLVDGPVAAGTHEIAFDGNGLASGVYVIRIEAGNLVEQRKMLLIK